MFYLLDDNLKNQQEEYGCHFIESDDYSDVLTYYKGILPKERNQWYDLIRNSKDKNMFFIHKTSADINRDGNILSDKFEVIATTQNLIKQYNISYVQFSGGYGEPPHIILDEKWERIHNINKQIFYLRLRDFLDFYKKNQKADLNILAYGLYYEREFIANYADSLLEKLNNYDGDILFEKSIFDASDLNNLELFLTQSLSEKNITEFIESVTNLKISVLKSEIKKAKTYFLKYGKNIYF